MKIRFLRLGIFALMVLGLASSARAETVDPALNPFCWKKENCVQLRKEFSQKDGVVLTDEQLKKAEEGWVQNEGECKGAGWGKCLPGNQTITQISFAGQTKFLHVGEFVIVMYKYALTAAGIIAAIMIIWAGFQWTMSGGNGEVITSAQHRIVGAVVGLFIAYGSYFILVNINPDLVNLRLPQVWMVKPINELPKFCDAYPDHIKNEKSFQVVSQANDQKNPVKIPTTPNFDLSLKDRSVENLKNFYCGKRFLAKGGIEDPCFGNFCYLNNGKVPAMCVDFDADTGRETSFYCAPGLLSGIVSGTFGLNKTPAVGKGDNIKLIAICKNDSSLDEIDNIDSSGVDLPYIFNNDDGVENLKNACSGDKGGILGLFLGVEVNDETAGIQAGGILNGGQDDWMAVGQSTPDSHDCSINLSNVAYHLVSQSSKGCEDIKCSCSYLKDKEAKKVFDKPEFMKHLLKPEDITKGYVCDIDIDRVQFPAISNIGLISIDETACD